MAKSKLQYSDKDLLDDCRKIKGIKDMLSFGSFVFHVDLVGAVSDPDQKLEDKIDKEAQAILKKYRKQFFDDLTKLMKDLEKLQADEKGGDKKAASKAVDFVKTVDKKIKEGMTDISTEIRKMVQKELTKATKQKAKLNSVSKNRFTGLKLAKGAFSGKVEEKPEAPDSMDFKKLKKEMDGFLDQLKKGKGDVEDLAKEIAKFCQIQAKVIAGENAKLSKFKKEAKHTLVGEVKDVDQSFTAVEKSLGALEKTAKTLSKSKQPANDLEAGLKLLEKEYEKLRKAQEKLEKEAKKS